MKATIPYHYIARHKSRLYPLGDFFMDMPTNNIELSRDDREWKRHALSGFSTRFGRGPLFRQSVNPIPGRTRIENPFIMLQAFDSSCSFGVDK